MLQYCINLLHFLICFKRLLPIITVGVGGQDRQNMLPAHFRVLHGLMRMMRIILLTSKIKCSLVQRNKGDSSLHKINVRIFLKLNSEDIFTF